MDENKMVSSLIIQKVESCVSAMLPQMENFDLVDSPNILLLFQMPLNLFQWMDFGVAYAVQITS